MNRYQLIQLRDLVQVVTEESAPGQELTPRELCDALAGCYQAGRAMLVILDHAIMGGKVS